MFGLIGSPNSAAGLAEMDALLREPNFSVTSMFLRTMSYLSLRAGDAPGLLQKQQEENIERARTALITALPLKRGKALALSTETALEGVSANSPESLRKMLSQQLLGNFNALPPESQASWLQYRPGMGHLENNSAHWIVNSVRRPGGVRNGVSGSMNSKVAP